MDSVQKVTSQPLPQARRRYETVVDGILDLVETQKIEAGQPLPTERDLAILFGVSRNVLRQAFGVLEERGLLRTVRGSGRYLREGAGSGGDARTSLEIASIADVLEARTLLEVEVARLACDRRTGEQARHLTSLARHLNSWEDNLAFHCAVAAATQNFVLERLVREQAVLSGELHQRRHYSDLDQLSGMRQEHQEIAAAITARDGQAATELTRTHLQRTRRVVFEAAALGEHASDRSSQDD